MTLRSTLNGLDNRRLHRRLSRLNPFGILILNPEAVQQRVVMKRYAVQPARRCLTYRPIASADTNIQCFGIPRTASLFSYPIIKETN